MVARLLLLAVAAYLVGALAWVLSAGIVRNGHGELLNVACDPTRELWRDINAAFLREYEAKHGVKLTIRQSHGGSGSQARAVIDGLPADVASLGLWTDTDAIRRAGLIDLGWENDLPNRSLPYISTIVFVVRKGNPKQIRDWPDLGRDDVAAITPNPKTSSNGKWSFLALWGSVVWRGGSEDEAQHFVGTVFRRSPVLDASARGATMTFSQKGFGDVHLTWENEALLEVQESGGALEVVYPSISVLAEPHVAIVDRNVDRKGTRAVAEAYLNFLYTDEGQEIIARHHHRPTNPAILARHRSHFPELDLRRATTLVPSGSWEEIQERFFTDSGLFDQIYTGGSRE